MREMTGQELEQVGGGCLLIKLIARKVHAAKAARSHKPDPKGHAPDDC